MNFLYLKGKAFEDNPAVLIRVDDVDEMGWGGAVIFPAEHETTTEGQFDENHTEVFTARDDAEAIVIYNTAH